MCHHEPTVYQSKRTHLSAVVRSCDVPEQATCLNPGKKEPLRTAFQQFAGVSLWRRIGDLNP